VEGLGAENCVCGPVVERNVLGGALEYRDARNDLGELLPHPGHRLHGDEIGAGRDELPCQLPRPRRQIDHLGARPDPELGYEELDRLRRVSGAAALVVVSGAIEAARS
jgi:hypothetical protein